MKCETVYKFRDVNGDVVTVTRWDDGEFCITAPMGIVLPVGEARKLAEVLAGDGVEVVPRGELERLRARVAELEEAEREAQHLAWEREDADCGGEE